ncbi:hypothetical protein MMC06_001071 [Schaereria dolodes]|nr:hypothetical protein [Schaereria dolodes]
MYSSLRSARLAIGRISRQQACLQRRTLFVPTATRQADFVQDLYLRELKGYKTTPLKPSDAEGHVQKFSAPAPPQSPEESNIANELKAYEDQHVEVEGQAAAGEASSIEEDWFEEDEDEEKHAVH